MLTPRFRLSSFAFVAVALATLSLVQCGIPDLPNSGEVGETGPPTGAEGGFDSPITDGTPGTDVADTGTDVNVGINPVGGAVHFLQSGGSLVLGNGADRVTVTTSGTFTFPLNVGPNGAYDVVVITNPTGQRCWIQNGTGSAAAAVSNVEVRCSVIKQSSSIASTTVATSQTKTFAAIAGLAPVTINADLDADVFLSMTIPSLEAYLFPNRHHVAFQIDGATIAGETSSTNYQQNYPLWTSTFSTVHLTKGTHSVQAVWKLESAATAGTELRIHHEFGTSLMDVVVLDSLPSYDKVATEKVASVPTAPANSFASPTSIGFTPMSLVVADPRPAFLAVHVPDVTGTGSIIRLSVDGNVFATNVAHHGFGNGPAYRTLVPSGLALLPAGTHAVTATIAGYDNQVVGQGDSALGATMTAVVFKNGTLYADKATDGVTSVTTYPTPDPYPFTNVAGWNLALNLVRPSKVMVQFSMQSFRVTPGWPSTADLALFVNGVQGATIRYTQADSIDWEAHGGSIVSVVDAPQGAVTIELKVRGRTPIETGRGLQRVDLAELQGGGPATIDRYVRLGAIALE